MRRGMHIAASIAVAFVAVAHLWFLVLEMFLWATPFGRRALRMSAEQAEATKILAANQGLYNGFLAAGLVWSLVAGDRSRATFFLGCVVVAGIYGAISASRTILFLQALPGAIALALVWGLTP